MSGNIFVDSLPAEWLSQYPCKSVMTGRRGAAYVKAALVLPCFNVVSEIRSPMPKSWGSRKGSRSPSPKNRKLTLRGRAEIYPTHPHGCRLESSTADMGWTRYKESYLPPPALVHSTFPHTFVPYKSFPTRFHNASHKTPVPLFQRYPVPMFRVDQVRGSVLSETDLCR